MKSFKDIGRIGACVNCPHHAELMARFAVQEHNNKQNSNLEFVRVIHASEAFVCGNLYHLIIEVLDSVSGKKVYDAHVLDNESDNTRSLDKFVHLDDLQLAGAMFNENLKFTLRSIFEKNKLNAKNFLDWERNLRIVLRAEGRLDVLTTSIPVITDTSTVVEKALADKIMSESSPITCFMLAGMEPDLQKRFEDQDACTIMTNLKLMFQGQARMERYDTHKAILDSKLVKGKAVGPHVFDMICLFDRMESLGAPYHQEHATDIILNSLHDGFTPFIMYYLMYGLKKNLNELYNMLKTFEQNMFVDTKKEVLNVNKGNGFKKTTKKRKIFSSKGKLVAKPKEGSKPKVVADHDCFYCKAKGHWKRNCPKYLEDKKNETLSFNASGIN